MNTALPVITGVPAAFATLSVTNGSWAPSSGVTFTVAWLRCDTAGANCVVISGATQSSTLLELTEVGFTIRARVTATLGAQQLAVVSLPTTPIAQPTCGNAVTLGPLTPSSVTTSAGMVPWANPQNALVNDGAMATVTLRPGESSDALEARGATFSLPPNAKILSGQVQVRHQASVSGAVIARVVEFANDMGDLSANLSASPTPWTTTPTTTTSGWPGFDSLPLTVINAPDFRARILLRNTSTTETVTASVDAISVTLTYAVATVVGPLTPSVITPSGTGVPWTTLSNIGAVDGASAAVTLAPTQVSQRIRTGGYGVTFPNGVNPSGIIIRIHRRTTGGTGRINDNEVRLVKGGAIVGLTRPSSAFWSAAGEVASYGSVIDLWGSTWTAADVTNSGFGLSFTVQNPGTTATGPGTGQVDAIEVLVAHSAMTLQLTSTPTLAASVPFVIPWSTPANASQLDGATSVAAALTFDEVSDLLRASGYGFAVPSDAFVRGITLESRRKSLSNGGLAESPLRLVVGGQAVSQNRSTGMWWPSALTPLVIGGPADLWGQPALTPAQVNAADFGVEFGVVYDSVSGNDWAEVDAVRLSVTYCPHP